MLGQVYEDVIRANCKLSTCHLNEIGLFDTVLWGYSKGPLKPGRRTDEDWCHEEEPGGSDPIEGDIRTK